MGLTFTGARDSEGRPVEYIGWAPARDLTDAECEQIGEEKVAALIASNLYVKAGSVKAAGKPAASAPAPASEGEEG